MKIHQNSEKICLKQNIKIYKEDNKFEDVLENIKRTHQANYLNNNRFNDIMK